MGYVMLQYHEAVGYEVDYEDYIETKSSKKTPKSASPIVNEIDIHLKEGNYDRALDVIHAEINLNHSTNPEIWDRNYQLLKIKQMNKELIVFGKKETRYFPL